MSGREELVKYIADERNSPMACVGAVVSYMKTHTQHGQRISDAIDSAIKTEVDAIKSEMKNK